MIKDLSRISKIVTAPASDVFAGDITTDAVDCSGNHGIRFLIIMEDTACTGDILVYKSDSDKSNNTAIPFFYRETDSGVAGDLTKADASGFTSAAGSTLVEVFVDAKALGSKQYCYLDYDENDTTATIGCIIVDQMPRHSA
jgi:hypothetical protein